MTIATNVVELLDKKIIPWAKEWGMQRFIVADETLTSAKLPDGVQLTPKVRRGRRVAVKGPRLFGNLSGTVARWPQDNLVEMRAPCLFCTITGRAVYQVGDLLVDCEEGHFLLIPAGVPYAQLPLSETQLRNKPSRPARPPEAPDVLAFSCWDNHMQCRLCHGYGPHLFVPNASTVQLLDVLIEEALAHRAAYDQIGSCILVGFLTMLRRDLAEGHCFGQAGTLPEAQGLVDRVDPIERVRRHIKSHLNAPLTIESAATMALMSRAQFTKRFRQVTGQSFVEYLTDCRLEETKMLLLETDWSIATIHNFVGFRDATRLRRIFQQHIGMSLSEYRASARLAESREAGRRPVAGKANKPAE